MGTEQAVPALQVGDYEPVAGRARAVTLLLWLCVILAAVGFVSDLFELDLLRQIEQGEFDSRREFMDAANSNDGRQRAIGIGQLALVLVTGLVFIAWFHRMYKNVGVGGKRTTKHGTGWAIGGWFVPILNLWRPKQIADEIYRANDPKHDSGSPVGAGQEVPTVLHLWWGSWIVSTFVWRAGDRMYANAESIDQIKSASIAIAIGDLLTIVSGVLAIIIVRTLSQREEEWARVHLHGNQLATRPT